MSVLSMDRLTVSRSAILLVLTFVVSLAVGWGVTRPFATTPPQKVTTVDYVAVVAQLYQHDHNAAIARERLNLLGAPTTLVQEALQAAANGQVKNPSDRVALESLAQALQVPVRQSELTATAATPASAAVSTPASLATPTTGDTSTGSASAGGGVSWVGPVAAFVLAFVLGAIVLMRTAGLGVPAFSLPRIRMPERRSRLRAAGAARPQAASTFRRQASARPTVVDFAESDVDHEEDFAPDEPVRARPAVRAVTPVRARPTPVRAPARRTVYQSVYRLGDDPYDEIHPIADPSTGSLVSACGLTAALKIESSGTPRYYAFTAWIQDYVSDDQLHAVGLVTSWALENQRAEIDDWVKAGQIEEVHTVQPGLNAELRTDDITTVVTIPDVELGDYAGGKASYFSQLTVRFEVQPGAGRDEDS